MPAPTHFLCVPLAGTQLARSLSLFKDDVTSAMSFGVPRDAVRPLGTLHLTLGVLSLKEDGVARAGDLLRSLRLGEVLSKAGAPADGLSITLQGLHAMQAPSKTSVLYAAPVDADGALYRFCEQLKATFQDAGLMADQGRPLLLHATVVNTVYVKDGPRRWQREKLTLDARDMLGRYGDYLWADDVPVTRVTLCRMGAKKVEGTDDEAYEVEAEVKV
ncbi:hypothetical protein AK830_g809 [Neonectria ditissima]|uniref:A-kinase anchor protein 7-like phosphoesterase domain-containing protein n=1 Tax=Neonectria ditissima TaxID=78410 RepID=A0A0P7BXR7_9HYPO|nr:hypothetical protein AK830_g809 [Neonectria ditissima]